jgi:hypothetical protein
MTRLVRLFPRAKPTVYDVWNRAPPTDCSSAATRLVTSTLPTQTILLISFDVAMLDLQIDTPRKT